MPQTSHPPSRPHAVALPAAALATLAVAVFAVFTWAAARFAPEAPAPTAAPSSAEAIARRTEAAFADATATMSRGGDRARVVVFRGATSSACVTGATGRGPFYCPDDRVAAFDLDYLEALAARLGADADLGIALVAGRLAAEHAQQQVGILDAAALNLLGARRARRAEALAALALQADCMAGAWAAAAEPRLGTVPPGFYGRLVWSARNVADALAAAGHAVPAEIDSFAVADRNARGAAFENGHAARSPAACALPAGIID